MGGLPGRLLLQGRHGLRSGDLPPVCNVRRLSQLLADANGPVEGLGEADRRARVADGNVTTATMHCGAQLQAAQQMEETRCQQAFWFSTSMVQDCIDASRPSGYETCLHVDQAFRRITWLDYCIICFVFAVISASTAAERYQQCCMESVSKVVSPGPIKLLQDIKDRKVKFESISSTAALLVRRGIVPIVLWLSELAVHFALLPSIVMTMVLLFVNTSLDAVTVVLNGVAITFLCHLDDFSLSLLVDDLERQHLQDFIIGRFYQNHEFSAPIANG